MSAARVQAVGQADGQDAWHKDWQAAKNILRIRLDYLGDILMMTPAIRALKQSVPGRRITLMTSAGGAAAAPFIADVDDVIEYAAPWMKASDSHHPQADLDMAQNLAARGFDGVVIFTTYSQSALPAAMLCYFAGIPLRLAHCREDPYQMLTHWVRDTEPEQRLRHEVRRQLDLVASIGCRLEDERMSFAVRDADTAVVNARLRRLGIDVDSPDCRRWILMHPGASAASRRYPPQLWSAAARMLQERTGLPLLFTGGVSEIELVEQIRATLADSHSLAGKLGLGQLAALISLSPVLVSNNTGPAHIAAAVGTPVVDLYALTNPQHTPWQVPSRVLYHDVPCRFCYKSVCPQGHHHCLTKVAPERVAQAAVELLEAGTDRSLTTAALMTTMPHYRTLQRFPLSSITDGTLL